MQPDPNQTPPTIEQEFQRRLQRAIFGISEKARSSDRHILDAYIKHVSPQLKHQGESQLPTALRRAVRDHDRHGTPAFPGILFFHIGNAVVAYYALLNGEEKLPKRTALLGETLPAAAFEDILDVLERRVLLLEQIAAKGMKAFRILGTDMDGFTLIARDEAPIKFLTPKQGEEQADPED